MQKAVIALILIIVCFSFAPVSSTAAQTAITVSQNEALLQFPDTVTFQIEAQSTAVINTVTLIYGTNGRTCQSSGSRQPLEFDADTAVSLNWEWELKRSGSLPPGAQIWWQWEITAADGSTLTTERQEMPVQDDRYTWRDVSGIGVTVHWYRGNTAFGEILLDEADRALERLATDLGVPRPDAVELWVYATSAEVRDALLNVPEWTGGVAFPEYNITVIGVAPGEEAWAAQIIPHELSHLVVGVRTFNCRGIRLPTWLDEGLARFSENNISSTDLEQLDGALANGRLPSLRSLANGFSAYGSSASLSYTQSYAVVRYLVETYGPEQMTALLITMQNGTRIDPALEQVYGFDSNGLDANWRETTGYAATPTSEADSLAAQATPTQVPTLAMLGPPIPRATATPTLPPTTAPSATPTARPTAVPTTTPSPQPSATTAAPATSTPAFTETPTSADTPAANWPWFTGGAALIVVFVLFLFIRRRGN